jgi:hypothetical protein
MAVQEECEVCGLVHLDEIECDNDDAECPCGGNCGCGEEEGM